MTWPIEVIARNLTARPIELTWEKGLLEEEVAYGRIEGCDPVIFSIIPDKFNRVTLIVGTPISANGTSITPGFNSLLYTADGTWSFGNDLGEGVAEVRLNGQRPNSYLWSGSVLQVDHGGVLFLKSGEEWWAWSPRRFTRCEAP